MKTARMLTIVAAALVVMVWAGEYVEAAEMGTAFTYQGHLYDANYVANGAYDFQFALYDSNDPCVGNQLGSDVNKADVDVIDGYFTVELDFGGAVFDGNAVWLEIGVRPGDMNDPNVYSTLSPRQKVTPTPYALQTRGIFVRFDYTWTAKESNRNWLSVAMSADGTKQTAVVNTGQIYVSTDSGNTWTAKESNRDWYSVAMSADGQIQSAVVVSGQIYVSTDSGNTWTAKESNRYWCSVAMSADGTKQTAVVNTGQIYISTDSGNTWTAKESNRDWYSVAMSADGTKQTAVAYASQIYVSTDSGNTWTAKESNRNWRSVAMSADGTKQTAVENGGQIYISTDSGNTWTAKESNRGWTSVAMSADGTKQTGVVRFGQIYLSTDSGNTWTAKESNREWLSVAMSADGTKQTAVVYNGQIYVRYADLFDKVGIGRVPATNEFEVEGNASKTVAGEWLANSDARIKADIQTVTNALETLDKVRLVSFRYSDDYQAKHPSIEKRRYLNVIAQEFRKVFPEYVKSSKEKLANGEEILQVDAYPLTVYSAAAVQELHAMAKDKDIEIAVLKEQNGKMESRLAAIEGLVAGLSRREEGGI